MKRLLALFLLPMMGCKPHIHGYAKAKDAQLVQAQRMVDCTLDGTHWFAARADGNCYTADGLTYSNSKVDFAPAVVIAPPPDGIAEMKAIAKAKKMRYIIFCTWWDDDPKRRFQAQLCTGPCGEGGDLDDMIWQAGRGATQEEAALDLVNEIRRIGFYQPEPKPEKKTATRAWYDRMRTCPPEISGDEFLGTSDSTRK